MTEKLADCTYYSDRRKFVQAMTNRKTGQFAGFLVENSREEIATSIKELRRTYTPDGKMFGQVVPDQNYKSNIAYIKEMSTRGKK